MSCRTWTFPEIHGAARAIADGERPKAVAARLQCSPKALAHALTRAGYSPSRLRVLGHRARTRQVVAAMQAGEAPEEAGARLGLSRATVYRAAARAWGRRQPGRRRSVDEDQAP